MKEHKKYLDELIEKGKNEDMVLLGEVFEKAMDYVCETNKELYDKLEMKLYIALNGEKITEEMADDIISKMQPYHMHWTLEETQEVQKQYGLTNIDNIDFWVVMNQAYNDYHELFEEDLEKYVNYSRLFIQDPDAKKGKVFIYFTKIPEM